VPDLDLTFLLEDPDFATVFDVQTQVQIVTGGGLGVDTPTKTYNIVGVVTALGAKNLDRVPEGQRQEGAIQVYTMQPLSTGGAGRDADLVYWPAGGTTAYTVVNVNDWSQFGSGWYEAICVLAPLSPSA
jgi:hypothetical protein